MKQRVLLEPFDGVIDPSFKCKSEEFTNFYLSEMKELAEAKILVPYIARLEPSGKVVGFATLTAKEVRREEIGGTAKFAMAPVALLGQLATHEDYERQGIAESLVGFVFSRAMNSANEVASTGLIVDSVPSAVDYYAKLGFIKCSTAGKKRANTKMFLPFPKKSE